MDKVINPIDKFKQIFEASELKYKTEPSKIEKSGFSGFLGGKKLDGYKVIVNNFSSDATFNQSTPPILKEVPLNDVSLIESVQIETTVKTSVYIKSVSASQLSKVLGVSQTDIIKLMQSRGYIDGDKITDKGLSKGLIMKNYMGNNYIAYPENLSEFNELK